MSNIDYDSLEPGQRYSVKNGRAVKYRPQILEGMCCIYGVPHQHQTRPEPEVFEKNCFASSLFGVTFQIDHKFFKKKLGDQDDDSLQLLDTDIGLAFRLKLTPESFEKLEGRDELSVGYFEHDIFFKNSVRHIRKAGLVEISAVHSGAIRTTFSRIRDADSVRPLADEVKHSFASEASGIAFLRALRRLN